MTSPQHRSQVLQDPPLPIGIPDKFRDYLTTALITCVALIVRVWNLSGRSLSYDEGFSFHFSTLPLKDILTNTQESNPPLYFSLLHIWTKLFGDSELSLRLPSVLCGILAILLIGWVARLIRGRQLAWISMGLLAIMPLSVEHSQIARAYSLFLMLSLASYGCLLRWEILKRTRWVVAYVLTTTLMCYAHYYALFNVIAQHLYLTWQVYRRRISFRQWMCLFVPAILGYLPCLLIMFQRLHSSSSEGFWLPKPSLLMLIYTPHFYVTRYLSPELVWAYVALAVLGLIRLKQSSRNIIQGLRKRRKPLAWSGFLACRRTDGFLLLWMICPLLIPFIWSRIGTPMFWPRYTVAAAPAFAMLVSQGLLNLSTRSMRYSMTCMLATITAMSLSRYHAQPTESWRALTATVRSLAQPDDALTISDMGAQWVFDYYIRGSLAFHPLPATVRDNQQKTTQGSLERIVTGHRRLWMVIDPEPFYSGRQVNELFIAQYPSARLFYLREFPGSPGVLYLFGYDL